MLSVLSLLLSIAEPCYGLEGTAQVEGRHLWVEYDMSLSEESATSLTEVCDDAWDVFVDELGWPAPPGPIAVRADLTADMAGGQCITVECGAEHVPRCHVFKPAFDAGLAARNNTAAHEIGHAFQYALMGAYTDSLTSWAWWMEGSATWISHYAQPHASVWSAMTSYIGNPQWALHNDFQEILNGNRGGHMYGTAVLAFFIDQYYGGPDTVRQTWEWGAEQSGERIFFPDAIEGVGIDFDEFWPHYLATLTVLDLEGGADVGAIPGHMVISELPGAGAPPPEARPEGLGIGIVRVPAGLGAEGMDLRVELDVDASVPWHAALAKTDGLEPGSEVIEYVRGEFDEAGHAVLVLPNFDGSAEGFLAVSPESIERTQFAYEIAAELVESGAGDTGETGAMTGGVGSSTGVATTGGTTSGTDTDGEPEAEAPEAGGCGCRSGQRDLPGWLWLVPLAAIRRRRA